MSKRRPNRLSNMLCSLMLALFAVNAATAAPVPTTADTLLHLKLWGLPSGLTAHIVPGDAQFSKVLRVEADGGTAQLQENYQLAMPLGYLAKSAQLREITFWVKVVQAPQGTSIQPLLTEGSQRLASAPPLLLDGTATGKWTPCSFPKTAFTVDGGAVNWYRVGAPGIRFTVPTGGHAILEIADAFLQYADGDKYSFLSDIPYNKTYTGLPTSNPPRPALPQGNSLYIGGALYDTSLDTLRYIHRLFPQYNLVAAPVWVWDTDMLKTVEACRNEGIYFQLQKSRPWNVAQALAEKDAFTQRWDGRGKVRFDDLLRQANDNAVYIASNAARECHAQEIRDIAPLGINFFKQVDYVTPWDGRYGYDEQTLGEIRTVLAGKDRGLDIKDGRKVKTIDFWDYFDAYRGYRFSPTDLGLTSWNEYRPVTEKAVARGNNIIDQRNLAIFLAFQHYEWLKAAQMMDEEAEKFGGRHDYTDNPEDLANGGDYVFLARMRYGGEPFYEYFGNPMITSSAYYNMPLYARNAKKYGSRIGVILEAGSGGHGQPYMDPELGFLMTYDLVSNGFDDYHNEWIDEAPYQTLTDPAQRYHYDRLSYYLSGAYGYDRSKQDQSVRPRTDVYSVSLRSVTHYMDAWPWNIKQMDSMAQYLRDSYVNFEQTDQVCYPDVLRDARVLFYTPPFSKPQLVRDVNKWLSRGRKVLFTHSYIPFSTDQGAVTDLTADLSSPIKEGKVLDFIRDFYIGSEPRDMEMVCYRGEPYSYADYLKPAQNATAGISALNGFTRASFINYRLDGEITATDARFASLTGQHITVPQYYDTPFTGTTLIALAGKPLLSERSVGKSRIIYLHCRPADLSADVMNVITNGLTTYCALPRLADSPSSAYYVHRYSLPQNIETVVVWDRTSLASYGFDCGGYLPGIDKLRIKYHDPKANLNAIVPVGKHERYTVYAYLQDTSTTVDGTTGQLALSANGVAGELFYLIPDTVDATAVIAKLRQTRAKLQDVLSGTIAR